MDLLIDLYELTMVHAYRQHGLADRPSTFSVFARRLPPSRGYLVAAGLDDVLAWLEALPFDAEALSAIEAVGVFPAEFLDWLAQLRFTGTVRAVAEGTVVFPDEPLLEIDAPMGQAQLAETYVLNQLTLQSMLTTKAARCRDAAGTTPVVDFGLRSSHGADSGMQLARACRIAGLAGTSNVAGALRFDLPASGTMAHSFVQAHTDERAAFAAFARSYPAGTILLVDTYDAHRGIERAISVAQDLPEAVRGIRIDSGDLDALSRHARRRLDAEGLRHVQVVVSGGLDEWEIERLCQAGAPIDGFGVGRSLATSADAPTVDAVYKLVAFDGRPVRKTSPGKETWPGAKQVWRADDWSGDVLGLHGESSPGGHTPLLEPVMVAGRRTVHRSVAEAAQRFDAQRAALPAGVRRLSAPDRWPVAVSEALRAATSGGGATG